MRSGAIELTRAGAQPRPARPPWLSRGMTLSLLAGLAFVVVVETAGLLARTWSAPSPVSSGLGRLLDPWNRWDAGWYLAIADNGYVGVGGVSPGTGQFQSAVAFPPLFPLSIRVVAAVLHVPTLVAATVIVMVCMVAAVVGLYRLATIDGGSRVGVTAVVVLLTFPTAFVLIAPYAEAPALALGVWAFIAARRRRWVLASLLVGAAVAAKLYAVVLVAGLLVEVIGVERGRRAVTAAAAVVIAPALALGGWMAWQAAVFGDPLRFLSAEKAWGRKPGVPMGYLADTFPSIFDNAHYVLPSLLDITAPFLLLGLGILAWRMRRSYAAVLLLSGLLFSSTTVYDSIDRYALGAFPLFIVAAVLLAPRPRLTLALTALSAAIGTALVVLFATEWFIG